MKIFILILWVNLNNGGVVSQEFTSKETCEVAGKTAISKLSPKLSIIDSRYVCVEK